MNLKVFLQSFGILAIVLALMPFVAMHYWWIRIFDFPIHSLPSLLLFAFLMYFFRFDMRSWRDYFFVILSNTYSGRFFLSATPFAKAEIKDSEITNPKDTLGILTANVLQKNDDLKKLIKEIRRTSPNVIVLTETNKNGVMAFSLL